MERMKRPYSRLNMTEATVYSVQKRRTYSSFRGRDQRTAQPVHCLADACSSNDACVAAKASEWARYFSGGGNKYLRWHGPRFIPTEDFYVRLLTAQAAMCVPTYQRMWLRKLMWTSGSGLEQLIGSFAMRHIPGSWRINGPEYLKEATNYARVCRGCVISSRCSSKDIWHKIFEACYKFLRLVLTSL